MYLIPSATLMSSLVTFSSGTRMRKPEVGFGVVGMKTATRFFSGFFLDFTLRLVGEKADGITSSSGKFHQHDRLEGIFVAGKRLIELLDRAIDLVQQRHVHHGRVEPFQQTLADVVTRQQADDGNQNHRERKRQHAPIPEHVAGLPVFVDGFFIQEKFKEEQQRVREIGGRAEQPHHGGHRHDGRQRHRQPGEETRPPAGKNSLSHAPILAARESCAREKRFASRRNSRFSARFIFRRAAGCKSSWFSRCKTPWTT